MIQSKIVYFNCYFNNKYAIPRKLKNPIMSVTIVVNIEEQKAGSIFNLLIKTGISEPKKLPMLMLIIIPRPKLKLIKRFLYKIKLIIKAIKKNKTEFKKAVAHS